MRQGEAVIEVQFAGAFILAQCPREFLPIGHPRIGTNRRRNLLDSFPSRLSVKVQQNMVREQRSPDSNHIALPLQRSLVPRISAKVRFLGRRRGSLSSDGRTVTASLGYNCMDSWPSTLAESCCSPLLGRSRIVDLLETMTEGFVRT